MSLFIYAENEKLRELLHEQVAKWRPTDSGFDIPMLEGNLEAGLGRAINLGIRIGAISALGARLPILLLPRSSIANTPIRLANSIGLIDMGYRGDVIAKVDCPVDIMRWDGGTRFFQLCRGDYTPWDEILIVENLEDIPAAPDSRGTGGFGSTGK
jgi:dUTP pyrophosphatase